MELYSTNHKSPNADLRTAVLHSLPADNGLYMPTSIPELPQGFFDDIESLHFAGIARSVAQTLIGDDIEKGKLDKICDEAINFDAPVVEVDEGIYSLELFHGPTLAFKDFGARFMARLMAHFLEGNTRELNILVATSGDTGGAVANGFYNVPGINVTILYPSGKVSPLQEKQLTTLGGNISALEVAGSFDDCQALVKQAFLDDELNDQVMLSSANSINIARLIPQSFYYFHAYAQLKRLGNDLPVVISVPSGNFGNLTGGLIAKRMGLPIAKFVAATNANDTFPRFLESGHYEKKESVATISNAMDVGNPSNFSRIFALYEGDVSAIKNDIYSQNYDDDTTKKAIQRVFESTGYILDPHGAVGFLGLSSYMEYQSGPCTGVFLETAHPSKFIEVVEAVLDQAVAIPDRLAKLADLPKHAVQLPVDFGQFKSYLLDTYRSA